MKKKIKRIIRILLFVLLGGVFLATFLFLWNNSREKQINYELIEPQVRTIQKKIIIAGKMSPRNEISLKPQISGIIIAIYKEAGQKVKEGEAIAKIKVIPDIAQLNNAESQLNMAQINFEQQQTEFERNSRLYKSGVLSKEEFEKAQVANKKANEELKNAKENLEIIKSGISSSTAQYSNTLIKSTVTGMILNIPVKVGNSVIQTNNYNEGTTIATIANMQDMIFIGKVDETEIGKIKEGNEVNLIIGAMQDVKSKAVLEYISPQGVLENGATTFEIKAAVKNEANVFIRSGYSANGEIIVEQKDSVLAIPESALELTRDSTFVYILKTEKPQQVFEKKSIEIGLSDGVYIEIKKGLSLNNKIRGSVLELNANAMPEIEK
ncbi:MAG: efflux RND transporter periplasmic adaptor subunit [Bacteroidales bacterium]|jgi:HlyD family secretion protein|nr:efflux RND transporter periplasmic adaptor subunit [Bacteroidales bacterium]